MSKVILPKEVAESIERVWSKSGSSGLAVKHLMLTNWDYLHRVHNHDCIHLRRYAENYPISYMNALVSGYEVEKTPEDLVRDYYNRQNEKDIMRQDQATFAIRKTLDLLGIKIKGVNE